MEHEPMSLAQLEDELLSRNGSWRGGELYFCCPCHDDHHPSARWHPRKQCWYCDVCVIGGGFMDLKQKLGVLPDRPTALSRPTRRATPPSASPDTFSWRAYATTLSHFADDAFLQSERIIRAATDCTISAWTDHDFEVACEAVGQAFYLRSLSAALQDLVVTLRAYGLEEEERTANASRRHATA